MSKRLRIVVSTPTFLPIVGGAELGIHEIYRRIGTEHDVTILRPKPHPRHVSAYGAAMNRGAPYFVHDVPPDPESSRLGAAGRAVRLTSAPYIRELHRLNAARIDVANFHFVRPHGAAVIYARRVLRIPTLLSLVGRPDVLECLGPVRRRMAEHVLRSADALVPISTYCLGDHPSRARARVIPYGVDVHAFTPDRRSVDLRRGLGITDTDIMLFTVQRLSRVKRVDILLRVTAELARRRTGQRVVLVVGGKGEEHSNLKQLAIDLGITEHVHFTGFIGDTELPAYFASAEAFVFHSMFETFGIVFAQAMATGTPIVAANTSCVSGVVGPNAGSLVEPYDIGAFADAILRITTNRHIHGSLSDGGRLHAEAHFNWDAIADAYLEELHRLAASTDSRTP